MAKIQGFHAHGDTIHKAASAARAKWAETRPLEDRIEDFVARHPELDEPYGDLFGDGNGNNDKEKDKDNGEQGMHTD